MVASIRLAQEADLAFLSEHDHELPDGLLARKIADSQIYVAAAGGQIVGWLRYGLLWDTVPFMNMLYILEPNRRGGIGRQLVGRWEQDMRERGFSLVMTSTLSNEHGQHFYRKLNYLDTGALVLPGEPAELLLRKHL